MDAMDAEEESDAELAEDLVDDVRLADARPVLRAVHDLCETYEHC